MGLCVVTASDLKTLQSLKTAFGNPPSLASWTNDTTADFCNGWVGVACNERYEVIELEVGFESLVGVLQDMTANDV